MDNSSTKNTLTAIIQNRQSIYPAQFTGEKIEKTTIEWILKNAIQAPSHRQTNPWRFHVIGPDSLERLAGFFMEMYKRYTAADAFNQRKYDSFSKKLQCTSHLLVIGMRRDPEASIPEWEEIAATACAVQNIYLSVTAAGLGGYWSSPALLMRHIEKFVSLEEGERCLGFFYLGVPQKSIPPKPDKGLIDDVVKWY